MDSGLVDPFRHNAWANGEVLELCRRLTPEQLRSSAPGTYGTILSTVQHIIGAEDAYELA